MANPGVSAGAFPNCRPGCGRMCMSRRTIRALVTANAVRDRGPVVAEEPAGDYVEALPRSAGGSANVGIDAYEVVGHLDGNVGSDKGFPPRHMTGNAA